MHFCNVCQNMYYIRIDADNPNKLVYYCRKCGNESADLNANDICVSKTYVNQGEINIDYIYLCSTCDTSWKTEKQG